MNITPYIGIDNLNFNDTYTSIKDKLNYKFEEDIIKVVDKKYPRIYVEDKDLMINFSEDYKSIRFFEFFNPHIKLTYKNIDLPTNNYDDIKKTACAYDDEVEVSDSGFITKKLGFSVGRKLENNSYTNKIESIIIFNKGYYSEPEIDLDELYKSIMGDDYDPENEVSKWV